MNEVVYVDDATSRLMYLHFIYTESTFSYFEATQAYLERYGNSQAFYSDKAGVFRDIHKHNANGPGITQFGRVLYEVNIYIWSANISQVKGCVERANLTLQIAKGGEIYFGRFEQIASGIDKRR